jgi:hypothetical protein
VHPFNDYESSDGVLRYRNRKPRRRSQGMKFVHTLKRLEQLKKRATAWQGQFTHNA